jgi:hypothetical protein
MKAKIKHTVEVDSGDIALLMDDVKQTMAISYESVESETKAIVAVVKAHLDALANSAFELGKKMALSDKKDDLMYE